MKNSLIRSFVSIPVGMRVLLLIYAASFPLVLLGRLTHAFDLAAWLGLSPAAVWQGQVWRVVTYGFLGGGFLGWAVNLFWLVTLVSILKRDWSSTSFWTFYLIAEIAGALPILIVLRSFDRPLLSWGAAVFALLVAWARLYGRERIILLGFGEMSVRQAAVFVAVLNSLIILFACGGWLFVLSVFCGGIAGWAYLAIGSNRLLARRSQVTDSERMARLEL